MKISYNWLKQYLKINEDVERVAETLTQSGLEVEDTLSWESAKGGLKGVVIGKVISCAKHPNADKLSVTTVDVGTGSLLPIVCGAPNVAAGQKVVVATPGTMIHKGSDSFEIKKAKIRGEVSEGMICAEDELGLGTSHDGIMVLPEEAEIGTPASEYFGIVQDKVLEIGLTPNRSDATSHIGVARDLAAALNYQYGHKKYSLEIPSVDGFTVANNKLDIDVVVEDAIACPRYSGLTISNVTVKPSPDWLKNRLMAIGIRPINNIVDITNYILFEYGQPLHAFDAAAVKGNKIVVKKMPQDTPFVTLDGIERKLGSNDLMICNESEPMCIGGVFGGLHSGVSENTKAIFLESACFDPKGIRKTARYHGLQTDASFRFERGTDPNITVVALKRAAQLIVEIAGGEVSSQIKDVYPEPINPVSVRLDFGYVNKIAGQTIEKEKVKSILLDLGITITGENAEELVVEVPTFKTDVTRPADLVEEILRIYGYNSIRIPEKLNASLNVHEGVDADQLQNLVADMLTANGFYEIMNNSLTKSEYSRIEGVIDPERNVQILNPLSTELDVMRQTLLFGGLETIAYNQNRKATDLKCYEFGKVYQFDSAKGRSQQNALLPYAETMHLDLFMTGNQTAEIWHTQARPVDFYSLKYFVETVIKRLNINRNEVSLQEISGAEFAYGLSYQYHGKELARVGKLNPAVARHFDLKKEVFYANLMWTTLLEVCHADAIRFGEVPKFPAVRRDLALVLDQQTRFEDIRKIAIGAVPDLLTAINIFDVYEGDKIPAGKKSYAVSFILLDTEKTLTDKVIEQSMSKLLKRFEEQLGAVLR